jgi:hypothetical protein
LYYQPTTNVWNFFAKYLFTLQNGKVQQFQIFNFPEFQQLEELVIQNTSCVGAFAIVKNPNGFSIFNKFNKYQ